MISPVVTIKEGMNTKKQTKMKTGVGSVVNVKVGELEKITKYERRRNMSKYMVVFIHSVVGKKNLLINVEDGKKREISSLLLVFLIPKEEVDMDEAI